MWELIFLIYVVVSLIFSSSISMQLKDQVGVAKITYYNNISLLVTVALLSMLVTFYLTAKQVCGTSVYGKYSKNAIVALIVFILITLSLSIVSTSSDQFKTCPAGAQKAIVANLVLNIIFVLAGLGFFIKQMYVR